MAGWSLPVDSSILANAVFREPLLALNQASQTSLPLATSKVCSARMKRPAISSRSGGASIRLSGVSVVPALTLSLLSERERSSSSRSVSSAFLKEASLRLILLWDFSKPSSEIETRKSFEKS